MYYITDSGCCLIKCWTVTEVTKEDLPLLRRPNCPLKFFALLAILEEPIQEKYSYFYGIHLLKYLMAEWHVPDISTSSDHEYILPCKVHIFICKDLICWWEWIILYKINYINQSLFWFNESSRSIYCCHCRNKLSMFCVNCWTDESMHYNQKSKVWKSYIKLFVNMHKCNL